MNEDRFYGTRFVIAAYNALGVCMSAHDMIDLARGLIDSRIHGTVSLWQATGRFCDLCQSFGRAQVRDLSFTTAVGIHFDKPIRCTTFLSTNGPDDCDEFLDRLCLTVIWDREDGRRAFMSRYMAIVADMNATETHRIRFSLPEDGTEAARRLTLWVSEEAKVIGHARRRPDIGAIILSSVLGSIGGNLVDFDINCVWRKLPFTVVVQKGYVVPNWRTDEAFPPVIATFVSGHNADDDKEDSNGCHE